MEDIDAIGEQIERLTRDSVKTSVLTVDGEPKGTYYLVDAVGAATKTIANPRWEDFELATPAELRRFVEANKGDKSAVFHTDAEVVFVKDQGDRRHKATCKLVISAPFQWLLQAPATIRQPEFVRLLRITFRNCLPTGNLLALVRNLKVAAAQDGSANIQHGRESIGKSITAAVTGESAIPEEVTLNVPVFENHPFVAGVTCAIEVMPQEQVFRMVPYPLEVRRALDAALSDIAEHFNDEGIPPIYKGKP